MNHETLYDIINQIKIWYHGNTGPKRYFIEK